MSSSVEAVIDTEDGICLVRDAVADTVPDQRAAALVSRISGSRGGRMLGAAGTVIQIRCAHQFSRPAVRIEVLDERPVGQHDGPWQWEPPTELTVTSGHIAVDTGDQLALPLEIAAGAYGVLVGHTGREEMRAAAGRVSAETLHAGADETHAAWISLAGTERYLLQLWSARN